MHAYKWPGNDSHTSQNVDICHINEIARFCDMFLVGTLYLIKDLIDFGSYLF